MGKRPIASRCRGLLLLLITTLASGGACLAASNDTIADRVLGQANFSAHGVNVAKTNGMYNPQGIAVDNSGAAPHHLYVSDTKNNRVLAWKDAANFLNGSTPNLVIGQPNFLTIDCGLAANRLCAPQGLAVDSAGNLLVADAGNNRVLVFLTPFVSGVTSHFVLGQSNFTSSFCGTTNTTLCGPTGVWTDSSDKVWVADQNNNRVLRFTGPLSNGKAASLVLGQSDFTHGLCNKGGSVTGATLCRPTAVAVDASGHVYVSDTNNSRVLRYTSPLSNGVAATKIFGQTTPTGSACTGVVSKTSLCFPQGVWVDSASRLWVADTDYSRVLLYGMALTSNSATMVFGQNSSFTNDICNPNFELDAKVLCTPAGVAVENNATSSLDNVYIADTAFNRVLGFTAPIKAGVTPTANRVVGQLDFSHDGVNIPDAHSLFQPRGIALDTSASPNHLYVADTFNNRILRWNSATGFLTGAPADLVIGQSDFLHVDPQPGKTGVSIPMGLAVHAGDLWVADSGNHRVVRFKAPINAGATVDIALGQANLDNNQCNIGGPNANTLCSPRGLSFDSGGKLYVADASNNRVVEYNFPQSTNQAAHLLFGQANFSSTLCNRGGSLSNTTLCVPRDTALDSNGNLFVADTANLRVLEYNPGHAIADRVYGEPDFSSTTGCGLTIGPSSLCSPAGVALDTGNRLLVGDNGDSRLLEYFKPLTKTSADLVFGQPNFTTAMAGCGIGASATSLCLPWKAVVDSLGNVYAADTGNSRVLEYDSPPRGTPTPTRTPTKTPTRTPARTPTRTPTPKPT